RAELRPVASDAGHPEMQPGVGHGFTRGEGFALGEDFDLAVDQGTGVPTVGRQQLPRLLDGAEMIEAGAGRWRVHEPCWLHGVRYAYGVMTIAEVDEVEGSLGWIEWLFGVQPFDFPSHLPRPLIAVTIDGRLPELVGARVLDIIQIEVIRGKDGSES